MKRRTVFELLLAATLVGVAYYLAIYVPKHTQAGQPVVDVVNYFLTYAPIESANQPAYVVPDSLEVWNTPAEIRLKVATLKSGEEVRVLGRFRDWDHVRAPGDRDGWVTGGALMNFTTHEAEEHLLQALSELPVQATGESVALENVHIEPSRQAAVVTQVTPGRALEIFDRRRVRRSYASNTLALVTATSNRVDVWYLVRDGPHAGWILGRRVRLTIPKSISAYAQDSNLVAWLALNKVNDGGKLVPQYVVAEREGSESCDFTKIEVLTWWKRKQTYAVAFRKDGLQGYFPIGVTHEGSVPYIRLRLEDPNGTKYQAVYGLFDTLTRLMGTADTWASDAAPQPSNPQVAKRGTRTATIGRRMEKG
ncbi:MAG TPA: hypothetical protein VJV74_07680 [Terriglobia bacterium]|nr:hypothetical protein [Terriglobia bacterium]